MDWQPIESAPKLITQPIILFCPKAQQGDIPHGDLWDNGEVFSQQVIASWDHVGEMWLMANIEFCELPGEPSHWRNLPDPPKESN